MSSSLIQWLAPLVSVVLLGLVVELVRRRKLVEEYALLWLLGAGALLALSIWRQLLERFARWLGIYYPPAALVLVVILFGFIAGLYFTVIVSTQRAQIARLVEDVAILSAQIRDLREKAERTDRS